MMGQLEGPTSDFATTGLPQLSSAVVTLQSAAESRTGWSAKSNRTRAPPGRQAPAQELEVKP